MRDPSTVDPTTYFIYQHPFLTIAYYFFEPLLMMMVFKTIFWLLRVCCKVYPEPLADEPQTRLAVNYGIVATLWLTRLIESIMWLPLFYFTPLAQTVMFVEWVALFGACLWIVSDYEWRGLTVEQKSAAKFNYTEKGK